MLRITLIKGCDSVTLKLEGRLVGLWAEELRANVLQTDLVRQPFVVDIRDLTFADRSGERVLQWLCKTGAQFAGDTSFSVFLCKRLGIPLTAVDNFSPGRAGAEFPAGPASHKVKRQSKRGA